MVITGKASHIKKKREEALGFHVKNGFLRIVGNKGEEAEA